MKPKICFPKIASVHDRFVATQNKKVGFAGKIIAPQTLFFAHDEIGVFSFSGPGKWCRRIELNSLFSESLLPCLEHDPQNHVTRERRDRGDQERRPSSFSRHQGGGKKARDQAGNYSPNRHFIWNNEMLEIDEDSNEEQGNKNPIGGRDRPWKLEPDGQEKKGGHEFHHEIAEGNWAATVRAAPPEKEPAYERNVVMPFELGITCRAKGAARLVHRKIERHSINADV